MSNEVSERICMLFHYGANCDIDRDRDEIDRLIDNGDFNINYIWRFFCINCTMLSACLNSKKFDRVDRLRWANKLLDMGAEPYRITYTVDGEAFINEIFNAFGDVIDFGDLSLIERCLQMDGDVDEIYSYQYREDGTLIEYILTVWVAEHLTLYESVNMACEIVKCILKYRQYPDRFNELTLRNYGWEKTEMMDILGFPMELDLEDRKEEETDYVVDDIYGYIFSNIHRIKRKDAVECMIRECQKSIAKYGYPNIHEKHIFMKNDDTIYSLLQHYFRGTELYTMFIHPLKVELLGCAWRGKKGDQTNAISRAGGNCLYDPNVWRVIDSYI